MFACCKSCLVLADQDRTTRDVGARPLRLAAGHGQVEVVHALAQGGVDKDRPTTENGTTPLHWAAQVGHVHVIRLLVEARAIVDRGTVLDQPTCSSLPRS